MNIFGFKVPSINLKKKVPQTALKPSEEKRRASYSLKERPRASVSYEIKDIYQAITQAINPILSDRSRLLLIYDYILNDGHLTSQMEQAKMTVLSEPFGLYQNGKIQTDTTKILQSAWFENIIIGALEAEFFGYSLLDAFPTGKVLDVKPIARLNVAPDDKLLLLDGMRVGNTIPYGGLENKLFLMQFGKNKDLGTLLKCSFNVIYKFYARSDWSRASEKFGMPILHIKANTNNDTELDHIEQKAANFGTDGYIVTQAGDEAFIVERKSSDMHKIYLENISYCDEQNSKVINGQTGTSDEKAFAGSAQVHERMQNTFTVARLRRIKYEMNDKVIPYLVNFNIIPDGLEFDYNIFREDPLKIVDPPIPPDPLEEPPLDPKAAVKLSKKKLNSFPSITLGRRFQRLNLSTLDTMLDGLIDDLYHQHKAQDTNTAPIFKENYASLRNAVDAGCGKQWFDQQYGTTSYEMQKNLRTNAGVFAAFKKHDQVEKMVAALRDDSGNLRSISEFTKAAREINSTYQVNYLKAEYLAADRASRTAVDWGKAVANQHLYPNIEYTPSRSAHPRDEHKEYYGIILPVNDPFWDSHLPPIDWGCKCGWKSSRSAVVPAPNDLPPVPPAFAHNPGKDGQVFSNDHPFYRMGNAEFEKVADAAKKETMRFESGETFKNRHETLNTKVERTDLYRKEVIDGLQQKVPSDITITFSRATYEHNLGFTKDFWDRLYTLNNLKEIMTKATFKDYEVYSKDDPKSKKLGFFVFNYVKNGKTLILKVVEYKDGRTILYHIKAK